MCDAGHPRALCHSSVSLVTIYLLPVGSGRFELYSEPHDDEVTVSPRDGPFSRYAQRFHDSWRRAVQTARRNDGGGRFERLRDWAVCRAAEMIAEQRTLWAIRNQVTARFVYPSDMTESRAAERRRSILADAKWHHGVWGIVDGLLFVASGLLALIPGPNLIAYYFGLRLVGHYLSWRGARQGLDWLHWEAQAEPALAELAELTGVPRAARASRVAAIAEALQLPRLAAFFDRTAVPAR
jgi:hypothetical protein